MQLGVGETLAKLGDELVGGLELGVLVDPVVGEVGEDSLFDLVDRHLEVDFLTGAIAEPGRERRSKLDDIPGR